MSLTGDEIRWRLEQLISLRLEVLEAVYDLTGDRRRFSFYEIARAARLLDGHFPDSGVAADALVSAVKPFAGDGRPSRGRRLPQRYVGWRFLDGLVVVCHFQLPGFDLRLSPFALVALGRMKRRACESNRTMI
jgi:hypothetical protein